PGTIIDWVFATNLDTLSNMFVGQNGYLHSDHLPLSVVLQPSQFSTPLLNCDVTPVASYRIPPIDSDLYHTKAKSFRLLMVQRTASWLQTWTDSVLQSATCDQLEHSWAELMNIILTCGKDVYGLPP